MMNVDTVGAEGAHPGWVRPAGIDVPRRERRSMGPSADRVHGRNAKMRVAAQVVARRTLCGAVLLAATGCAPGVRPGGSTATLAAERQVQELLDSVNGGHFPGMVAGVVLSNGRSFAVASGYADTVQMERMRTDHRLLAGSVGKTFVAAVALQLVAEGKLTLDDLVTGHLPDEDWLHRLPNAERIRVRHLMNHSSGLVRYELDPSFLAAISADPMREWTPQDRLAYLFDGAAPFPAGEGWEYSDTNYILLGLIIEKIHGRPLYLVIQNRLLRPLRLPGIVPSDQPRIERLSQGYAGPDNPFGGFDAMVSNANLALNPQFEWAGGGFATTAEDLARWAKALYEARAVPRAVRDSALAGAVEAPMLGPDARYGLGVIIQDTPLGPSWGHSGFMPGYRTEMRYWPTHGIAVVLQVNTTSRGALVRPLAAIASEIAEVSLRTTR
jgi:D-alanyl-D-alanine carboxypeptidase